MIRIFPVKCSFSEKLFPCPEGQAGYLRAATSLSEVWGGGEKDLGEGCVLRNSFGLGDIINTDCLDDWEKTAIMLEKVA